MAHIKDHQKVSPETEELSAKTPAAEGKVDDLGSKLNDIVKEGMDKFAPYGAALLSGFGSKMLFEGLLEEGEDDGSGKPIDRDDGMGR